MPLVDTDDRPAPEQASQTLTAILRACAADYAARSDFARLQLATRSHDTPQLLKWLDAMISYAEQAQAPYLEEAEAHQVQAARSLAAWWTLARWFTARPHPVLALLLLPDRESLAHRAEYLPKWAVSAGAQPMRRPPSDALPVGVRGVSPARRRAEEPGQPVLRGRSVDGRRRRRHLARGGGPRRSGRTGRSVRRVPRGRRQRVRERRNRLRGQARKPQPSRPAGRRARPASASTATSPARRPIRPLPRGGLPPGRPGTRP